MLFQFLSNLFSRIISFFSDLLLLIYSIIPELPSVTASLDALDLLTQAIVACKYFLPLDTIAELTAATVGLFAFKIMVGFMRSEFGQKIITTLLGKLANVLSSIISLL